MMPLTEEQTLIRDTARAFARDKLAPNAARWDREARFPLAAVGKRGTSDVQRMIISRQIAAS
ncbi:MAG: acyl-CoA dehydrogenase family protein [Kiloniellales bacterium]